MSHPSFLALDRFALAPDEGSELARHVEGCVRCRAHVEAVQRPLPVPDWARAAGQRRRPWLRWLWAPAGVAMTAAVALLVVVGVGPSTQTLAKGGPSVTVWLKRGETVAPWAGDPLRAGDAVRLQVEAAGYRHLAVLGTDGTVLYRGPAGGEPALTPAWELDEAPADERLVAVLSREPVADAALPGAAVRRDAEIWAVELVLKREPRR